MVAAVAVLVLASAPASAQVAVVPSITAQWAPVTVQAGDHATQRLHVALSCFVNPLYLPAGEQGITWRTELAPFEGFRIAPIPDIEDPGTGAGAGVCWRTAVPITLDVQRDTAAGTYLLPITVRAVPLEGNQIAPIRIDTVLQVHVSPRIDWHILLVDNRPTIFNAGNVPLALQVFVTHADGDVESFPVAVPVGAHTDLAQAGVSWGDEPVTITATSLHDDAGDGDARTLRFEPPVPRVNLLPGIVAVSGLVALLGAAVWMGRGAKAP